MGWDSIYKILESFMPHFTFCLQIFTPSVVVVRFLLQFERALVCLIVGGWNLQGVDIFLDFHKVEG